MDVSRLREWRERRALSQRDLAAAAGITASTIARLELGYQRAYPQTVRKLADALGIEPTDLGQKEKEG